jgi:hypothetical protein
MALRVKAAAWRGSGDPGAQNRGVDDTSTPPAQPGRGRRPRRNTRPRDQLGRPLPYGSAGVAAAPEGVVRSPAETVRETQRLLDEGFPFQAHEVLEEAWKTGETQDHELWRGLAQLAVGITHAARGNPRGAAALLQRGAVNITPWAGTEPYGMSIDNVLAWAEKVQQQVAAGQVPDRLVLATL